MSVESMESSLTWMIAFMCLLSLSQKTKERTQIAMTFAFLAALHAYTFYLAIGTEYNPYLYYLSAALIDFFIVIRVLGMQNPPELAMHLYDISLFSLAFNLFGWFASNLAIIPLEYSMLYIGIYSMAILCLMTGEPKDGVLGGNKNNLRFPSLHPHAH
jgi:hypothetical protein